MRRKSTAPPTAEEFAAFVARIQSRRRRTIELANDLEKAARRLVQEPRAPRDATCRALEFLALQAHQSFLSVRLLAAQGWVEDAGTIVRRLMELSVAADYIGAEKNRRERERRARCYLVGVWNDCPVEIRRQLPIKERQRWQRLVRRHETEVPPKHRCRLPKFELFAAIGKTDTYKQDYDLLCAIAHGGPPTMVLASAVGPAPLATTHFLTAVLGFACRYYLGTIGPWAFEHRLKETESLAALLDRAMTLFDDQKHGTAKAPAP